MKLELVIDTIRQDIKSTILMHILRFDISFHEKAKKKKILFSVIFCSTSHFSPQTPKCPNRQSANMAHFEAYL